MRARTPSIVALVLAVAGLAVWRGVCVLSGPDLDTDAYAHHMIARAILAAPHDLSVHWVWLPLFHYLQVPLVALGGTMDDVRWMNVLLAAILPVVLFGFVRSTCRAQRVWTSPDATALIAALIAAACPIAMQMGTTAQPEPLFALLMLGVAITYQRRHYGAAAAMLSAATMLRYEAWAAVAAVAALTIGGALSGRRTFGARDGWRAWTVIAAPVACILVWAILRRPVDGRWFGFLRDTREFASGATHEHSALDRGILGLLHDALYYPVYVPIRVMGPVVPLIPFGIVRTVRQQGARFVLVLAACLAFVSLSWVMRSSLGLDRHFVVVVPLYATFAAQGLATLSDRLEHIARRFGRGRMAAAGGRLAAGILAIGSMAGLSVTLDRWMGLWQGAIERGWPERTLLGAYLRSLPDASKIFCDDATLEILSGVDRHRFDRHWVDDPQTWGLITEAARAQGVTYVATWRRKLRGHEQTGDIVFHAGAVGVEPNAEVVVMRVAGDASRAAR